MQGVVSRWGPGRWAGRLRTTLILVLCLVYASACFSDNARADRLVTVFAAASLSEAMTQAGDRYTAATGVKLRFSFASSSTLARQIETGAPAQIYISANEFWMDYLEGKGLIAPATRVSAIRNALVLIAPQGSAQDPVELSRDISIAALLGPNGWIASGDPAHVPAGIYAMQALQALGQWRLLKDRLARSDNVRAALALVAHGEARLGIVYATDARISDNIKTIATFPKSAHGPITYPFAIVAGNDGGDVRHLFDYLTGTEGLAIFHKYGFTSE